MSIILERPVESEAPTVTVSVSMDVTRDMLATALDLAMNGHGCGHPDTWPVETVREAIKQQFAMDGAYGLRRDQHLIAEMVDDPTVGDFVRAEYRAVDRAYPELDPEAVYVVAAPESWGSYIDPDGR